MRLVVIVPQAFAGVSGGHPPGLEVKLHMIIAEDQIGAVAMPTAQARTNCGL
jgi:hypothetical protein